MGEEKRGLLTGVCFVNVLVDLLYERKFAVDR